MTTTILLDGRSLSLEGLIAVAHGAKVSLCPDARQRMEASRQLVDEIAAGDEPVYGINTGFGALAEVAVEREDLARLQRNLVLSHAVGVGPHSPLPKHGH